MRFVSPRSFFVIPTKRFKVAFYMCKSNDFSTSFRFSLHFGNNFVICVCLPLQKFLLCRHYGTFIYECFRMCFLFCSKVIFILFFDPELGHSLIFFRQFFVCVSMNLVSSSFRYKHKASASKVNKSFCFCLKKYKSKSNDFCLKYTFFDLSHTQASEHISDYQLRKRKFIKYMKNRKMVCTTENPYANFFLLKKRSTG